VHDDVERLLDSGVDAVVIATPDHLHSAAALAAAERGIACLIEKPLATSIDDSRAIRDAAEAAGIVAMCLFNHRWVPAYAQAKQRIGELGEPVVAYARKNDTIHVPTEMLAWAEKTTCAWFLSSHDIDLVTWLFGRQIEKVSATARSGLLRSRGIDTPDAVQIQATFEGGAIATFESAWIYPNTFPTMVDSYVSTVCERGVIQLDRQTENIVLASEERIEYPRNMLHRVNDGAPAGAYKDAIEHFVRCVREGRTPDVDLRAAHHVTAVLDAAHRSLVTGRTETVDRS
jgi:predicted dehydrogenase